MEQSCTQYANVNLGLGSKHLLEFQEVNFEVKPILSGETCQIKAKVFTGGSWLQW